MLKKVYIHNFRNFVNFEMELDNINLLMGKNGSGKTSLFEVLQKLQQLICDNKKVEELFSSTDLPRTGYASPIQKFELQLKGNGGLYSYVVEIEHDPSRRLVRIRAESLTWNDQPLYEFKFETDEQGYQKGDARLYNDAQTHREGIPYPGNWARSGVGSIYERHDNTKLIWFKQRMDRFFIVQPNPFAMQSECQREESHPVWNLSNYAAWFAHLNNQERRGVLKLEKELAKMFEGFEVFQLSPAGESKLLKLEFTSADKHTVAYKFSEISAGQKALIILYTLLYCSPKTDYTLCIDEPENFLALPEIQPWLHKFYRQCEENGGQGILISHHPQLINYLANDKGIWLSRENQVIRAQKVTQQADGKGLSVADLLAMGWIYDE
jgi:ABC-type cobalamin/Fe3+-siderophores transport system ATPase subunit